MNGVYIRNLNPEDFVQRSLPFLEKDLPPEVKRPLPIDYIRQFMPLVQERTKTLGEVAELTRFFFIDRLDYDPGLLIGKKMSRDSALEALKAGQGELDKLEKFTEESLEAVCRPLAERLGLKTGQLFGTLRVAVTGRTAAPPLFQTMAVLGKELCLKRIQAALNSLSKSPE